MSLDTINTDDGYEQEEGGRNSGRGVGTDLLYHTSMIPLLSSCPIQANNFP